MPMPEQFENLFNDFCDFIVSLGFESPLCAFCVMLVVLILISVPIVCVIYYWYSKRHPYKQSSENSQPGRPQTLAEYKGSRGESVVARHLEFNSVSLCHVINDVIITDSSNKYSNQIDHIVVNNRGVIVIETKNYQGRIYGSEHDTYWTQVLAYGKSKHKFYNPVKQNEAHAAKIRRYLNYTVPVYSLVVFVQNNTQYIHANNVIGFCQLNNTIESIGVPNTLSSEQMDTIAMQLWDLKNKNDDLKEQHIQYVQSIKNS